MLHEMTHVVTNNEDVALYSVLERIFRIFSFKTDTLDKVGEITYPHIDINNKICFCKSLAMLATVYTVYRVRDQ
jgi:hypothetical protein